ncbi:hypothetical protein RRG08_012969 [Elysia crispata]|uniref:Uncharacterized protein n=1 Tax=Elysia crispata TaxID=231223 RepID=A0AAE1DPU6_9GAST|nr:hypothetical protein RRG08_012969 [Elysia crispata]
MDRIPLMGTRLELVPSVFHTVPGPSEVLKSLLVDGTRECWVRNRTRSDFHRTQGKSWAAGVWVNNSVHLEDLEKESRGGPVMVYCCDTNE